MDKRLSVTVGACACSLLAFAARAGGSKHDEHESSCSPAVKLTTLGLFDTHCPGGGVKISTACADDDRHDGKGKDKDDLRRKIWSGKDSRHDHDDDDDGCRPQ